MSNNTIVKIILFIFFNTFFGFLFWYFYQPETQFDSNGNVIVEDRSFSNLFPFSNSENNNSNSQNNPEQPGSNQQNQQTEETTLEILPKLRQISNIPVAGVHIETLSKTELFDINKDRKRSVKLDESDQFSEIRYVSTKNNHIFQTYDFTKIQNRISNVTIPKIFSTHFFNKNNFIIRYENQFGDKKNYSVTLSDKTPEEITEEKKETEGSFDIYEKKFQGVFFPDNIEQMYVNEANQRVFYTTFLNTNGEVDNQIHGITSNKGAEEKKEIFSSELKEWNINFNNVNNILLSNKASSQTQSIPFSLNTKTAQLKEIIEARIALHGIPNYDFSKIVFTQRDDENNLKLSIYNVATKEEKDLEIATFMEKCVWSKNNIDIYCGVPIDSISETQPDDWYKGKNYFQDDIFKINTNTLSVEIIYDSLIEEKSFDITDLKIDDRERYLYWKNKSTDFAWSYQLPESVNNVPVVLTGSTFSGEVCTADIILTQNLQPGDRNGSYSSWEKDTINEVIILQKHMNRLGFNAGTEDGILGVNTSGAIKRMQQFLGTFQDAKVGPITRGLLNKSC